MKRVLLGIITSVVGTYMVKLGRKGSIMGALYKGFWTSAILAVPAIYVATAYTLGDMNVVLGGAREAAGLPTMARPEKVSP